MSMALVLSIVGCFISLGLAINAFFLRGILKDLNTVRVELAIINERGNGKEKRIEALESNQKDIFERLNKLERGK